MGYEFDTFDLENLSELDKKLNLDSDHNIKSLIYIVPFNQNPSGYSVSKEKLLTLGALLYNNRNNC